MWVALEEWVREMRPNVLGGAGEVGEEEVEEALGEGERG